MNNSLIRTVLSLCLAAVLVAWGGTLLYRPLLTNRAYLGLTSLYYSSTLTKQDSIDLLRTTLRYACQVSLIHKCDWSDNLPPETLLKILDEAFVPHATPIRLVAHMEEPLTTMDFTIGGTSTANRNGNGTDRLVLWGNGYLDARLFVFDESIWRITVNAMHDDPPPVLLSIQLDRQEIAQLIYGRGDLSWEAQSTLSVRVVPGFHSLSIQYINDRFEMEQGLDRNAYFGQISISHAPIPHDTDH